MAKPLLFPMPRCFHLPKRLLRHSISFLTSRPPRSRAPTPNSPKALAHHLATQGPVRILPANRRIRIHHANRCIFDTTDALYVWEHDSYPYYYVPAESLLVKGSAGGAGAATGKELETVHRRADGYGAGVDSLAVVLGKRTLDGMWFTERFGNEGGDELVAKLRGYVRVEFGRADAWYEEDTRIYVHPKDPFKRVDILHSTRPIRVFVDGHVVAEAPYALHLHETGLPARYYLPPTAIHPSLLREASTLSRCPYKGDANYYDLEVKGALYRNLIWYYKTPTIESIAIAGHLCFYNEKVDIELDGQMLERPVTKFS